jgi:hypothetical protein
MGSNSLMTISMVVWMVLRKHGWRHSFEMALAMLVPVAVLMVVRLLGADIYVPWLAKMSWVALSLGMLAAMLHRKDHYTGQTPHSGHAADLQVEAACHRD